jgi:hypothetical protein
MFASATAPTFDALGAAATAASQVIDAVLQPQRLARLVDFHRRDNDYPGADEVLDRLVDRVFDDPPGSDRLQAIARVVQSVLVDALIDRAGRKDLPSSLRAPLESTLAGIRDRVTSADDDAHARHLASDIARFLGRPFPAATRPSKPADLPPGSPIGSTAE